VVKADAILLWGMQIVNVGGKPSKKRGHLL